MSAKRKAWQTLALVAVLLAACAAEPESTPTPTTPADTIQVDITPSARFAVEAVTACDAVLPDIDVRIFDRFPSQTDGDLLIRLGAPEDAEFLAQIANEVISAILHPDNPATSLTPDELAALFSGQVTNWSQVGGTDAVVNVWALLPADETRQTFDEQIMTGLPIVPDAGLAPDPAAMQEAVSADLNAIGYLPDAWLDNQLAPIPLAIQLPVLAAASQTPEGPVAELVACLQGPVGQLALSEYYP